MQTLQPGTTLQEGKYKVERVLGTGSFGVTYLAMARMTVSGSLGEMETTIKVALKEFFMEEINTRNERQDVEGSQSHIFVNYRRKFRREAENLSHVRHPNIVGVLDVFDENNTTYYAMQYVEGRNLDDYIAAKGRLGVPETLHLLSGVMAALEFIHSKRMLHLDLKPKNIMWGTDGKVYLIDFGLSKQFADNGEPESSTSLGLGTPGYAPLEQAQQRADGTFPATLDIYSLGATMYKMLTGIRPPQASDIFNDGFPEQVMINANVNGDIIHIVKKAMSPSRKERFQSMREMREVLEGAGMKMAAASARQTAAARKASAAAAADDEEGTLIEEKPEKPVVAAQPKAKGPKPQKQAPSRPQPKPEPFVRKRSNRGLLLGLLAGLSALFFVVVVAVVLVLGRSVSPEPLPRPDTALGQKDAADTATVAAGMAGAEEEEETAADNEEMSLPEEAEPASRQKRLQTQIKEQETMPAEALPKPKPTMRTMETSHSKEAETPPVKTDEIKKKNPWGVREEKNNNGKIE